MKTKRPGLKPTATHVHIAELRAFLEQVPPATNDVLSRCDQALREAGSELDDLAPIALAALHPYHFRVAYFALIKAARMDLRDYAASEEDSFDALASIVIAHSKRVLAHQVTTPAGDRMADSWRDMEDILFTALATGGSGPRIISLVTKLTEELGPSMDPAPSGIPRQVHRFVWAAIGMHFAGSSDVALGHLRETVKTLDGEFDFSAELLVLETAAQGALLNVSDASAKWAEHGVLEPLLGLMDDVDALPLTPMELWNRTDLSDEQVIRNIWLTCLALGWPGGASIYARSVAARVQETYLFVGEDEHSDEGELTDFTTSGEDLERRMDRFRPPALGFPADSGPNMTVTSALYDSGEPLAANAKKAPRLWIPPAPP